MHTGTDTHTHTHKMQQYSEICQAICNTYHTKKWQVFFGEKEMVHVCMFGDEKKIQREPS